MTKNEAIISQAVYASMGKQVIIREIRGKIVLTDKPEFEKRVLSKKQNQVTSFMAEANGHAKWIIGNESLRDAAQIRLNVTRERLYTALVSEFWKTKWESEKKKQEAEDAKEKERSDNQKKENLNLTTSIESTMSDVNSENKNSPPDAS